MYHLTCRCGHKIFVRWHIADIGRSVMLDNWREKCNKGSPLNRNKLRECIKMSECHTKAGNQAHSLTRLLSHSLTQSLSTCWTTFVFMAMLKNDTYTLLPFNLSFSLSEHAEQLLFSCLCWKVTLSLSHSLIHCLSTCWTTFFFMSRLNCHCL